MSLVGEADKVKDCCATGGRVDQRELHRGLELRVDNALTGPWPPWGLDGGRVAVVTAVCKVRADGG